MDFRRFFNQDYTFKEYLKPLTLPYVSAHEYKKLCKWNLCPRYIINFHNGFIEPDDLVFLNGDLVSIEDYTEWFRHNPPENKFRAVIHNTDEDFYDWKYDLLKPYTTKIYTINNLTEYDDVVSIPLGFSDNSQTGAIDELDWLYYNREGVWEVEKDRLCLVKFWRNTLRPGRGECFNHFFYNTFRTDIKTENDWLPQKDHYQELKRYKYQVCPRGQGLDTHRFYESILFDVIPIVKISEISTFYKSFPCVMVMEWEDIDEYFLEENYDELYEGLKTWKEENPNWLYSKNWIK